MVTRALLIQENPVDVGKLWTLSEGTTKVGDYPTLAAALAAAEELAGDVRKLTGDSIDIVARDRIGAEVMPTRHR